VIFARAIPEEVKVTETYEVEQVISVNPWRRPGKLNGGRIEITVPYDGLDYFTRQAARDVRHARSGPAAADPDATIGHLVLANHDDVERLPADVKMHAEYGVLPIEITLPETAELTAGRCASVITHQYQPQYPRIVPAELRIDVTDPDDLDFMGLADALASTAEDKARNTRDIGEIRQKISFQNIVRMGITVRLALPFNPDRPNRPAEQPVLRRVSIDWPTITSLRTTELEVCAEVHSKGRQVKPTAWRKFPVRYNPVDRRLEWEMLNMSGPAENGEGGQARTIDYQSLPMQLLIGHPGELYLTPKLKVRAEIEIPGYLMSGLDPRLFSVTGRELPEAAGAGPDLTTRVTIDGTLEVDDAFKKRSFTPHHSIVFDDIIPDEMRVTDIRNVLKNLGFGKVDEVWKDTDDPDAPRWFLKAERRRGPDQMDLWIYVDGTRHVLEREQVMGNSTVKTTRSGVSGQIRLYIHGRLPRDHQEMTREMNAFHKVLRDRYRYHMLARR
jgi:hypothetical protein